MRLRCVMVSSMPLSPNHLNQMRSTSPFCTLEAPLTKPHDADQLLEMLGPSHHAFIFRHHCAHSTLVASTERPTLPTSTPLLDALRAEKSAKRDKEAIQKSHPHYKGVAHAFKKDESKKTAAAVSSAASEAKQGGESTAPLGKRAAKRAAAAAAATQKMSSQPGPATQPKAGNAPVAQPAA